MSKQAAITKNETGLSLLWKNLTIEQRKKANDWFGEGGNLDVSKRTFYRWLKGETRISLESATILKALFNELHGKEVVTSTDEILGF